MEPADFAHQVTPPAGTLAQLAKLRVALPGYDVIVTRRAGQPRYEAIRRRGDTGPWCVISRDLDDLWRELIPDAPRP